MEVCKNNCRIATICLLLMSEVRFLFFMFKNQSYFFSMHYFFMFLPIFLFGC